MDVEESRMSLCIRFPFILGVSVISALVVGPAFAKSPCENLAALTLANATIASATSVPAGPYKPSSEPLQPPPRADLPAFCRVVGTAKPTSDSEIKFEVWLPASGWNGKFEQVGNGGFAGNIPVAAMVEPLLRGYATAGTDDGHVGGRDVTWAIRHPEKVIDFGYRAVHETSVQAKAIIREFYGKDPSQSYFVGCSDGGREALMEAQRFPADFRGIVAGAPANHWTHLMFRGLMDERALDDEPASYIPHSKLPVLQNAALAACDAIDGVKDGLIQNPRLCRFNPAAVQCKGADGSDCLTAPQVEAARKIYGPVKDSQTGAQISPGFAPGTEAVPDNWQTWITGAAAEQFALGSFFANAFFADMVFENPQWDFHTLNFGSDVKLTDDKLASILNSTDANLRPFKARGGKLIQYHGWGDAAIPPQDSIDYFESVQSTVGAAKDFYRLFMVPGMSHCSGGIGANVFGNRFAIEQPDPTHDVVMALDEWVLHDVAPDRIIATGFVDGRQGNAVAMTRPLCPYPQDAHYKGTGDTNSAASFVCRAPATKAAK
ncbi:MAG TPA: tannase/feruloyl esterase family alpha/beta hydrolase [Candidatus Acidoferrales bacterium]|nr:tannase/feruloyl esterase family alpha/beta hydrolase [Candidatus Acidoferrales bacterium]